MNAVVVDRSAATCSCQRDRAGIQASEAANGAAHVNFNTLVAAAPSGQRRTLADEGDRARLRFDHPRAPDVHANVVLLAALAHALDVDGPRASGAYQSLDCHCVLVLRACTGLTGQGHGAAAGGLQGAAVGHLQAAVGRLQADAIGCAYGAADGHLARGLQGSQRLCLKKPAKLQQTLRDVQRTGA